MEESTWCSACKAATVHFDLVDCTSVCERCGCVQEDSSLVAGEFGGGQRVDDVSGASAAWRLLDRSRAGRLVQQEAFKRQYAGRPHAIRRVAEITDLVHLPPAYRSDVEALIDEVLQGEWGQGRWLDILVAACVYIVIRQKRLALSIADVASAVQSNPIELGATYRKVLALLHLQLPEADPIAFIRSAVSRMFQFQGRQRAKKAAVIENSELFLRCAENACLLTGRRPLPLGAAIFFQAAEANQVKLTLEQVCETLGAATSTAALRLRELRAALAGVGQTLPWGRDITESNVKEHLTMILQLLRLSGEVVSQDRALTEHAGSLEVLGGRRGAAGAIEAAPRGGGGEEDSRLAENVAKYVAPVAEVGGGAVSADQNGASSGSTAKLLNEAGLHETLVGSGREVTGFLAKPDTGKIIGRSGAMRGRFGNGKKRARDSDHRAGTPENMEVGPLGSYVKLRKTLGSSPEETARSVGGGPSPSDRKELEGTAQQTGMQDVGTPVSCIPIDLAKARSLGVRAAGWVSGASKLVEEPDWKERPVPPEAGGRKEGGDDRTESKSTSIGNSRQSPLVAVVARLANAPRSDTSCDWKTESELADLKGDSWLRAGQQGSSLMDTSLKDSRDALEGRENHSPMQRSSVSGMEMNQQDRANICAPVSRTSHGDSIDCAWGSIGRAGKHRVPPLHRQSEQIIDVFEPEYVNTPPLEHIDRPEIVPHPETVQLPGFVQTVANVQGPLADTQRTASFGGQDEKNADKSSAVIVRPMGTADRDGVQTFPSSEVRGVSGEGYEAPPFGEWSGLPPSFRAQAIERQRRAVLIAETKQRLFSLQDHLGIAGESPAPESVPALKRLPKVRPTRPGRILLAPKRKRNAILDPEWEARTVEALLTRGADERLLLEGQYEQARLQLEAARPRNAEEDDDMSEYIRSDAEVELLCATQDFLESTHKRT